ncbi:MAG: hypothetical protein PWQ96_1810 [Clostridia bacterium]|nr:hypothetical protein [Clostridia bacterium]
MKRMDGRILVGGCAKPPKEITVYNIMTVQLLVDVETNCIVESNFNLISPLTQACLEELVNGYCIDDSLEPLFKEIKEKICLSTTGSLIQAIKNAVERYKEKIRKN